MAIQEEPLHTFIVSSQQASLRLDKLLSTHFPNYSRTYFQFLISQGSVLVNNQPIKKRMIPKEGDEIEVYFILTEELTLTPQNIALNILYEDEDLIAINKPAGMVVHPAPGHPCDTFVNALLFHCKSLPGTDSLRPGIVHRLDKDTSGILLAAKTLQAHGKLVELFSKREVEKYYLAICVGTPPEGLIDAPIGRDPIHRKEMSVNSLNGRSAQSQVKVIAKDNALSFVEVQILTGRTHQIRVHLKHKGFPVLGDAVYGSASANSQHKTPRQLLHAHKLRFIHPIKHVPIELEAPIPQDLEHYVKKHFTTR
jgi:23S rRNA pseudouridine1911/1915/1917 synthase